MLDRSLALGLEIGPWAASGEDSSQRSLTERGPRRLALFFYSNAAEKRIEALGIASTYLVGTNESGNQKGNLSYLAGTKKRSDSLIQLIFHKRGARADEENDARALF
jgi:hypothetical protein